jgi:RNA polymerase sigma-70 factor, ECF subfamily
MISTLSGGSWAWTKSRRTGFLDPPGFFESSRHKLAMDVVLRGVQPEEITLDPAGTPMSRGRRAMSVESLFREHYARIVTMLTRLTGDRAHAEEIAADVFHKLSRRPELLAGQEDLTAWIYRVATNAGLDGLRMNSRRRKREEAAGSDVHVAAPPDALDSMLREERRSRVREVLGSLKPREAQLLLLRANGLAYKELAETLGVEPGSIGTMLARAEAEFERKFRARYGEQV